MPVLVKNSNTLELSYTEPTLSADETVLNDLKETRAYFRVVGGVANVIKIEPASSPVGGKRVTVIAQATVLPNTQVDAEVWVTAVDVAGNESVPSNIVPIRIDMVAPKAPLL